jgi:ribose 5-phosphate isomerase B
MGALSLLARIMSEPVPRRIAFGADDVTSTVSAVREHLSAVAQIEEVDGTLPWPLMASGVARLVASGRCELGFCWTGSGSAIAPTKVAGVRAAQASEPWIARGARQWNDANVLALSSMRLAPMVALECVEAFLQGVPKPEEQANIELLKGLLPR